MRHTREIISQSASDENAHEDSRLEEPY